MAHDCSFLGDLLGDEQVAYGDGARESHAADWGTDGTDAAVRPDVVVWPESTADVSAVLSAADDRGIPVTPYAAGTGLEGGALPAQAGISMDLTRLDAVLDIRPADFQIDVQAGVLGTAVDEAVASEGLFFPPLPTSGSISTVGGMIATDAAGQQTVRYGEIRDWTLRLEAVLPDGSVISAGSRAVKHSSGYNLKDLLVGSEGTLAVVTEATLQLAGRPEQIRGGRALFSDLEDATAAVADAVQSGVDVAKIELIDPLAAAMANDYLETDLPDCPMVFLEFHADHCIEEEIDFCRSIFEAHDVDRFEIEAEERMADLWDVREELAYAIRAFDPDLQALHPGDVTVPISKYPEIVRYAKSLGEESGLLVPVFGHAGDGNVHYTVLVDPDDEAAIERGEDVYDRIVRKAINLGGTCTGEHGIGQGKQQYLVPEHGSATVEVMERLKQAFDPNGILNPGTIFPEEMD